MIETEFTSIFNNLGQVLTSEDDGSKISLSLIVSHDETNLYDAQKCLFSSRGEGGAKTPKRVRDNYKSATSIMRVAAFLTFILLL